MAEGGPGGGDGGAAGAAVHPDGDDHGALGGAIFRPPPLFLNPPPSPLPAPVWASGQHGLHPGPWAANHGRHQRNPRLCGEPRPTKLVLNSNSNGFLNPSLKKLAAAVAVFPDTLRPLSGAEGRAVIEPAAIPETAVPSPAPVCGCMCVWVGGGHRAFLNNSRGKG